MCSGPVPEEMEIVIYDHSDPVMRGRVRDET
jgi:hypothetical protein